MGRRYPRRRLLVASVWSAALLTAGTAAEGDSWRDHEPARPSFADGVSSEGGLAALRRSDFFYPLLGRGGLLMPITPNVRVGPTLLSGTGRSQLAITIRVTF